MKIAESHEEKEPTPDQYGLTEQRVADIAKRLTMKDRIVVVSIVISVVCFFLIDSLLIRLPFFLFFVSVVIAYQVGVAVHSGRIARIQRSPDYSRYVNYRHAADEYLKVRRRIRWEEARERTSPYEEGMAVRNKWSGIDGRLFEIEVARILVNKGYVVDHVGGNSADGGVDIVVTEEDRRIIVQCKAFTNYISPGYVRELYGTLIHEEADEAWLVTTSGFYSGAITFSQGKPIRLFTIDQLTDEPPSRRGFGRID